MAADPSTSTWSDRFEQGLHPAIERFNASIGFDIALLQEDLDGSVAHARMLGRCGVITSEEADRLIGGLETIRAEAAAGRFNPGIEAEDVHFAVERRLIDLLGPLGKKLHTGRSRNDQVGTDLRLWLRRRIDAIDRGAGAVRAGAAEPGRGPRGHPHPRLHPPAAGPARLPGPPPAGLRRDGGAGPAAPGRRAAPRQHLPPRGGGPGRHAGADRPAPDRRGTGLRRDLRQQPRRGQRSGLHRGDSWRPPPW